MNVVIRPSSSGWRRYRPARRAIHETRAALQVFAASVVFACAWATGVARAGDAAAMDTEIDFLIGAVAGSSCTFIRNGKEHDAEAASEHLQMKRKRGKRYYDSTEEFIERIASKSSWSGRDYLIRCGSGATQTANAWFSSKLDEYRGETS